MENVKITKSEINHAKKFINQIFKVKGVKVKLLRGYMGIEAHMRDGTTQNVFAAYSIDTKEILLPEFNGDTELCVSSLFHEHIHAYDVDNENNFTEEEVEEMTSHMYEIYKTKTSREITL